MPTVLGWVAIAVLTAAGVALLAVGVDVRRRYAQSGTAALSWYGTMLGAVALLAALLAAFGVGIVIAPYLLLLFSVVPWTVFALTYTGRGEVVTRPRIAGMVLLLGVFAMAQSGLAVTDQQSLILVVGVIIWFAVTFVAFIGALIISSTTFEYDHLPLALGLTLSLTAIEPWILYAVLFNSETVGTLLSLGLYASGFSIIAVALAAAVYRYGALEATVAAGTVGREVMVDELDDPLVVVDEEERVIEANPPAVALADGDGVVDKPLSDCLGHTVDQFQAAVDVEFTTPDGSRVFDAQVTAFTDQHDAVLGHVIGLRDVTDRQLRRQRLEVLNRVLRHNLRNKLLTVQGNAQLLADGEGSPESATLIADAADDLVEVSESAREIEKLLGQDTPVETLSLEATVSDTVATHRERWPDASFTVDVPPDLRLDVQRSLLRHGLDHLVENAVEHNDDPEPSVTVTGTVESGFSVRIEVRDDGPGIPKHERAVIERGQETALDHGSGFGLWATKWAVVGLGGTLELEDSTGGGTIARITLPPSTLVDESVPEERQDTNP